MGEFEDKIAQVIRPVASYMGLDVLEVRYVRQGKHWILRVVVDRPEGGVTLRECEELSRQLNYELDVADLIPGSYLLEVTSPGVDRPLKDWRDFRRVKGRQVEIFLNNGKSLTGTVVDVDPETVFLEEKGERISVFLADVKFGKQRIGGRK